MRKNKTNADVCPETEGAKYANLKTGPRSAGADAGKNFGNLKK